MTRDVCIRNLLKFSETLRRKLCFKDKLYALTRVYIVASRAVQINTDFNVNFSRIYILEKKNIHIYIYIYIRMRRFWQSFIEEQQAAIILV